MSFPLFSPFYSLSTAFLITFILILIVNNNNIIIIIDISLSIIVCDVCGTPGYIISLPSLTPFPPFVLSSSPHLVDWSTGLSFSSSYFLSRVSIQKIFFVVTYVGSTYYLDIMLTTPLAYFAHASGFRFSSSSSLIFFRLFHFSLHCVAHILSGSVSFFIIVSWYPQFKNDTLIL